MELSDVLGKIVNKNVPLSVHFAVIQSHNNTTKTVTLTLAGGTSILTGVRYIDSYANPQVNDVVLVLINRKDMIVLGHLA